MKSIKELLPLVRTKDINPKILLQAPGDFENHIATRVAENNIIWAEPGTNINKIEYLCHNNYLIITGDWGESIFQRASGFEFWAFSDLDYIMSKICACSETGGEHYIGKQWYSDEGDDRLTETFHYNAITILEGDRDTTEDIYQELRSISDIAVRNKRAFEIVSLQDPGYSDLLETLGNALHDGYIGYTRKLDENYDFVSEYFGQDFYEITSLVVPGMFRSRRIDMQFIGLRLALAQLGIAEDRK